MVGGPLPFLYGLDNKVTKKNTKSSRKEYVVWTYFKF